jgi:hypothetical protein
VQLHAALTALGTLIVLPLLDLKRDATPRALWRWFVDAVAVVNATGIAYPLPQQTDNAPVLGVEVRNLCVAAGTRNQIVLVDGFEEIAPERRKDIESFLAGILMGDNAKIILTRRDEQALISNALRCVDEQEVSLSPLPSPEEQIRQRLEQAPLPLVNWRRETWEEVLDTTIATLTVEQRAAILAALVGHLTSNPYINARLLALFLDNPTLPVANLKGMCLDGYLKERAGLNENYTTILRGLVAILRANGPANTTFTTKQFGSVLPQSDQLEMLMVAGIVSRISGTLRYQLDPAVAALI